MDLLNHIVFIIAQAVSRLLDPAMGALEQFNLTLRQQLASLGVPFDYQATAITVGCALVLFMIFRILSGVPRIIFVLLVAVALAKIYGVLPPA